MDPGLSDHVDTALSSHTATTTTTAAVPVLKVLDSLKCRRFSHPKAFSKDKYPTIYFCGFLTPFSFV